MPRASRLSLKGAISEGESLEMIMTRKGGQLKYEAAEEEGTNQPSSTIFIKSRSMWNSRTSRCDPRG